MNQLESTLLLASMLICVTTALRPSKKTFQPSRETPELPKMNPQNIKITCRECGKHGRLCDFNNNCDNERCMIVMARKVKNSKPPAILAPAVHPKHCVCDRCLDAGATAIGMALLTAKEGEGAQAPKQIKKRVVTHLSPVLSYYDDKEETMGITVPDAISVTVHLRGKRK